MLKDHIKEKIDLEDTEQAKEFAELSVKFNKIFGSDDEFISLIEKLKDAGKKVQYIKWP